MAGLNALQSKIKFISSVSTKTLLAREQSVIYLNDDGTIDWPDTPTNSSGVLCVPKVKTSAEWLAMVEQHQRKHSKRP